LSIRVFTGVPNGVISFSITVQQARVQATIRPKVMASCGPSPAGATAQAS
jgi:hypothetical protein